GVAADVELATVLVVVPAGFAASLHRLVGTGQVFVRVVVDRVLGHVGHGGELEQVVVGDVPVELGDPARNLVPVLAIAVGRTAGPPQHACLVLLLDLARDVHEQPVPHQRATCVGAVTPGVDFVHAALLV